VSTIAELEAEVERLRAEHAAFRGNVRTVAMKHARQHNLCRVVERALEEAGLNEKKVRLTITANVPKVMVVDLPEDLIEGLTDEQVTERVEQYLAGKLNGVDLERAWAIAKKVSETEGGPTSVTIERSEVTRAMSVGVIPDVDGYLPKYGGYDGRKAHYVQQWSLENSAPNHLIYSACGRQEFYRSGWHEQPQGRRSEGLCLHCANTMGVSV
jgi:hypothetical protein